MADSSYFLREAKEQEREGEVNIVATDSQQWAEEVSKKVPDVEDLD